MIRLLASLVTLVVCTVYASADVAVSLSIDHRMNGQPFAFGTVSATPSGDGYIKPTSLRYYVSNISITHDGGQELSLGALIFLVDLSSIGPLSLGTLPVTTVERITFHIGVDSARNHLDPTKYPPTNPLSPQDPSMHWGWKAGYKFLAYDGYAGYSADSVKNFFQIHSLGDTNYYAITVPVVSTSTSNGITLSIQADYAALLQGIDVRKGIVWHGEDDIAATQLYNMANYVFSTVTSVASEHTTEPFRLAPNPASARCQVLGMEEGGMVDVTDVRGISVASTASSVLDLSALPSGMYVARYHVNGVVRAVTMLIHDAK